MCGSGWLCQRKRGKGGKCGCLCVINSSSDAHFLVKSKETQSSDTHKEGKERWGAEFKRSNEWRREEERREEINNMLLSSSSTPVSNHWNLTASATMSCFVILVAFVHTCAHVLHCTPSAYVTCTNTFWQCMSHTHTHTNTGTHTHGLICSSQQGSIQTQGESTTLQWRIHHWLFSGLARGQRDNRMDTASRGHSGNKDTHIHTHTSTLTQVLLYLWEHLLH